jgi:hypothetical protein
MIKIIKFFKTFQKNKVVPKNEKLNENIDKNIITNDLIKDTYNNFISDSYKYKSKYVV